MKQDLPVQQTYRLSDWRTPITGKRGDSPLPPCGKTHAKHSTSPLGPPRETKAEKQQTLAGHHSGMCLNLAAPHDNRTPRGALWLGLRCSANRPTKLSIGRCSYTEESPDVHLHTCRESCTHIPCVKSQTDPVSGAASLAPDRQNPRTQVSCLQN